MNTAKTILLLLLDAWFALRERRAAEPSAPPPEAPPSFPAPETGPAAPEAPQILVPRPKHADRHGPASSIARAMERKGYVIFERHDEAKGPNLNIVAIRSANPVWDRYNCRLAQFWFDGYRWIMRSWIATTLPGHTYMVDRLLNPRGCAILRPGQYRSTYRLRPHRQQYQALCQDGGPVQVYRDGNRDRVWDFDPRTIDEGYFGINIHAPFNPDAGRAAPASDRIAAASAGCVVFARANDFVQARDEWRLGRGWGENFTFTLLTQGDLDDPGAVPADPVIPQIDDASDWHPEGRQTVGIRNRNVGNVKQGRDPWRFSIGADGAGHAIFQRHAHGVRAMVRTLRTYWVTHRLRTLAAITARWAPATGSVGDVQGGALNQPARYAEFLAGRTGHRAGDALMLFTDTGQVRSPEQLFKLVAAMVEYENYAGLALPRWVFDEALRILD